MTVDAGQRDNRAQNQRTDEAFAITRLTADHSTAVGDSSS